MNYGVALGLLGVAQAALAWRFGGWAGALLLWSGASFALVGLAYSRLLVPDVLGKRPDGTMTRWRVALLLPYLLFTWGLWHLQRLLTREPPCCEVAPGLYLGRRPMPSELPPDITLIADLTAEFPEPRRVIGGRAYRCLPTLDAAAPRDERELRALVGTIAASEGAVYVHCALGHGRSALAVAAALLAKGLAQNAAEAEAIVKKARPGVRLHPSQRAALERLAHKSIGGSESHAASAVK